MKEKINIVWYKKDLRVSDHKPLYEACKDNLPVIALYVREPTIMQASDYSHFHQYWIQESLKDLKLSLTNIYIPLLMRYGEVSQILHIISDIYDIGCIYSHEETGNNLTYMRDIYIAKYCKNNNIVFLEYPNNAVVRKLANRDERDTIWKERIFDNILPIPNVRNIFILQESLLQLSKKSFLGFVPVKKPVARTYSRDLPGEKAGFSRLMYFLSHAGAYRYALSRPELSTKDSSRLSAYITYGNISIRQVYQFSNQKVLELSDQAKNSNFVEEKKSINRQVMSLVAFRSRIHRHCHFIQKLESQPSIEFTNQNNAFDNIRTEIDDNLINLRYRGQTGIPMIDAGMRCLQVSGWINFRMRATLVSFVCNTCMQPWQSIGPMLARLFVDYEPGIHYSQLQMQSATTGINTIRIYNPLKQLQEKDSELFFVRKWIPEISGLTNDEIYTLGTLAGNELILSKGISYPTYIVDIISSNKLARIALWGVKKTDQSKTEARKVYQKLGSRKSPVRKTSSKRKVIISQNTLFSEN